MNKRYADCAMRWAHDRWHLDETDIVEQWCRRGQADFKDPTELVDWYAEKYGLHDYTGMFGDRLPDRTLPKYQP